MFISFLYFDVQEFRKVLTDVCPFVEQLREEFLDSNHDGHNQKYDQDDGVHYWDVEGNTVGTVVLDFWEDRVSDGMDV